MPMPQILQQLGKNNIAQMLQPVKQMMNMVRSAQNPQAMLDQLASTNPQMKQVMDIINQHGGDPMKALKETAGQMGFNSDDILNMLK